MYRMPDPSNALLHSLSPDEDEASIVAAQNERNLRFYQGKDDDNEEEGDRLEEDVESEDASDESIDSWIQWFCGLDSHKYFVAVPDEFIEDEFNLTGLSSMVPHYLDAMDVIRDLAFDDEGRQLDLSVIQSSAELLYCLIHQRYINSRQGLAEMCEKYKRGDFGHCPRAYCNGVNVLPIGLSDIPGKATVKVFCPCCADIYQPNSSRFHNIDGVPFGTTFPHLFFKTYPELFLAPSAMFVYEPKVFGFCIHSSAPSGPKMRWLREYYNFTTYFPDKSHLPVVSARPSVSSTSPHRKAHSIEQEGEKTTSAYHANFVEMIT